jgi:hypothetical protein
MSHPGHRFKAQLQIKPTYCTNILEGCFYVKREIMGWRKKKPKFHQVLPVEGKPAAQLRNLIELPKEFI